MSHLNVWTIPSSRPFFEDLIRGLWDMAEQDHEKLADMHILLPTKRACRVLQESFLTFFDGQLLLMPDIRALGDLDEDELAIISFDQELTTEFNDIPPAISPLRRQMFLARILLHESDFVDTMDQAISLAGRLGRFFDEILTEGISFENLKEIVPDDYSEHWQKTLSFLTVLTDRWPEFLAQKKLIDPADRRNRIFALQNKIWLSKPVNNPIIVAGVTGTIPAAATLLKTVASMPCGHVVFPGVDLDIDDDIWKNLDSSHPQHGFKTVCDYLEINLNDIRAWQTKKDPNAKEHFLTEVMRPANISDNWYSYQNKSINSVLEGWRYIECDHEDEEAECVSFIAREALEDPSKTIAIVTPDRTLARRVAAKMTRWDIDLDDSAGVPLVYTPIGIWLLAIIDLFENDFSYVKILTVLRHVLCRFSYEKEVALLDKYYFRSNKIDKHNPENWLQFLKDQEHEVEWLEVFISHADSLRGLYKQKKVSYKKIIEEHLIFAQKIGYFDDNDNSLIWQHDDGEAAAYFFHDLFESLDFIEKQDDVFEISPVSYGAVLKHMMQNTMVRPKHGTHPRVHILGLMEARLINADRVILCGLNEGVWPPEPKADPFLSRHMRVKAGLPSPDKIIGMSAHDFIQKLCMNDVIMTRSRKVGGSPALPSRWLVRMEAILKQQKIEMPYDTYYLSLVRSFSMHDENKKITRPSPCPPVDKRPKKLSVSSIKKWMSDPYGLYAEKILRFKKLDPLQKRSSYAEKGQYIHKCLEEFLSLYPRQLDDHALDHLLEIGERYLEEYCPEVSQRSFWWNRFKSIASFFIAQETRYRKQYLPLFTEREGTLRITHKIAHLPEKGEFIVRAIADRIDQNQQTKSLAIIDYKSGTSPTKTDMQNGVAPQLPIEALIAQSGGYGDIAKEPVETLQHWVLKGENSDIDCFPSSRMKDFEMQDFLDETLDNLTHLIELFTDEQTPYLALPNENLTLTYNDYEHLERVSEWQNDESN